VITVIKIRKYQKEDLGQVCELICCVFKQFQSLEGTKDSVEHYLSYYNYKVNGESLNVAFLSSPIMLVAEDNNKIVGVLRGKENRLVNLYVIGEYHRKGIGGRLYCEFEKRVLKLGSKQVKIRSSLYAVPFYQRYGYKKVTGVRTGKRFGSQKYQPMIKKF